jgi:hypothetical protein
LPNASVFAPFVNVAPPAPTVIEYDTPIDNTVAFDINPPAPPPPASYDPDAALAPPPPPATSKYSIGNIVA